MVLTRSQRLKKGKETPPFQETHQTMVTIKVGSERKAFVAHKELLCYWSSFFHGALHSSFKESTEGVVTLPKDEVHVFRYLLQWIYTRRFLDKDKDESELDFFVLIEIYVFADAKGVANIKNQIILLITRKIMSSRGIPDVRCIHLVYDNTVSKSPLRKLMTDLWAFDWHPEFFNENADAEDSIENSLLACPQEFVADVALAGMRKLRQFQPRASPFEEDIRQYYEQEEIEPGDQN